MLVSFHKGFIMEGETTFKERKHFWSKPVEVRQKIYSHTGINGICDDSELDAEVERLTNLRLASSGWGEDFSGWQKILTYEECIEVAEREGWTKDYTDFYIPEGKLTTETLDNWTVEKAAKNLTGKQFSQYCKDYHIWYKGE